MEHKGEFWDVLRGDAPHPPVSQLLGWQPIAVDPEAGTFTAEYTVDGRFTNPIGSVQGGIIAAMLDDVMGPAIVSTLDPDQFAPTASMNVQFISAGKPGGFRGNARVIKSGKTIAFVEAELFDENETLVATAESTVVIRGPQT